MLQGACPPEGNSGVFGGRGPPSYNEMYKCYASMCRILSNAYTSVTQTLSKHKTLSRNIFAFKI